MSIRLLTPFFYLNAVTALAVFWISSITVECNAQQLELGEFVTDLNGLEHWYKVSGNGPVCIMPSPAWGSSSDLYFRTLKPLEAYFTVIYLDSRGCGRSGKPETTKDYTWDHLVSDLDALRAHLEQEKVWLMGHSEGGIEVLHYACKFPERVSGLVLFGASAKISPQDDLAVFERLMQRKDEPWVVEAIKQLAAGRPKTDEEMSENMSKLLPGFWAKPERIERYTADFSAGAMSATASAAQSDSGRMHFDLSGELKRVTAPALIVVGDQDNACPPYMARNLHLELVRSKLLVLEDCGHFAWLEQSQEFEKQLPLFLKALGVERFGGDQ